MRLLVSTRKEEGKGWGLEFSLNAGLCLPKREGGERCWSVRVGVALLVEQEEK